MLDLLGNENRRRIIELLSDRPCYVTEISESLGIAPKAVIDHLNLLEEAGVVSSSFAKGKRKYYNIIYGMHLEIAISPYTYKVDISKIENVFEKPFERSDKILSDRNQEEMCETEHINRMKLICEDLEIIKQDQLQLVRLQKDLCSKTDYLIHEFLKSAVSITDDDLETDVLFRILKDHLSDTMLCDRTGEDIESINKILGKFEEKGILDNYQNSKNKFWHIKKSTNYN
ncbi:MAG: ArsR family transcriptional regulator [Methanosarcinaceae archaeon]|nr:ArsR family transcriptional regulator [Methanosarcinaceae archaeon]